MTQLNNQKSLYLLQHANNPVDWYPWCDEAFKKASEENKPVFLSIGYSTCHWCHVMAHESFEDEKIAELFNRYFICIKVDREERPDIDNIYMNACHAMIGSGGWPLSIFLTPDRRPFFAATYIPKENKYGRMGLAEILPRIYEAWCSQNESICADVNTVMQAIKHNEQIPEKPVSSEDALNFLFHETQIQYDETYGGFGRAPKFPSSQRLHFLLSYFSDKNVQKACDMALFTLERMMCGGIYDHIGGGFHRYSTDKYWLLPHFEKMLYDQALLIPAYAEAYRITRKEHFAEIVKQTVMFCGDELMCASGGFYSALDADSEGEEGAFYLWENRELKEILSEEEYRQANELFLIAEEGNFTDEAKKSRTGKNILHIKNPCNSEEIRRIKQKISLRRKMRVNPHRDEKILADCNGMMISALVKAASVPGFDTVEHAIKCADFLIKIIQKNGGMFHAYIEETVCSEGFIDDYAFVIQGMLDLYESTEDFVYFNTASREADQCIEKLWGETAFYYAAESSDRIIRTTELFDGAIPSGNAVMLKNLRRLFIHTKKQQYQKLHEKLKTQILSSVHRFPQGCCAALSALIEC